MSQIIDSGIDHVDNAPGDERLDGSGVAHGLVGYLIGLGIALALTLAAFYLPRSGWVWPGGLPGALIMLAIAQIGVHLVFFLHITTGPESTNNVLALAFGGLIVFLMLAGTAFIMGNLSHNMPPMSTVMDMQR